jgi:MFS transporter, DHA2 family, multidrug resistance protein
MSGAGAPAPAPLKGAALVIASIALALGTFMQVLDSTIANVSLPTISGDLGVSSDQGTWVITAFAVANGIGVPITGWLMARFGMVRVFVASVALFTLASFLCGMAWSLSSLVIFRVLQGGVSGPMIPGSQALLISIFPPERRGTALAIWAITTLVAPVLGPIVGGYISDNYHWSWIFLINVPIGILSSVFSWRYLASRETPRHRLPIDKVGLWLLVIWVGSLQIMLDNGKDADWFSSTSIVILALVAVVGFIAWTIWELTSDSPVVDLSLFANRNFALGTVALCLGYAVFFANNLLLPLWLQEQLGYTATWAGIVSAPSGLVAIVVTPIAAALLTRFDARITGSVAFVAFAVSYFWRAQLSPDASFWAITLPVSVQGVSMGTFFVALVGISLDGVSAERIASASGLSNFARIIAGGFAAAITTTLWDYREDLHQTRLVERANNFDPAMSQALARLHHLGFTDPQSYGAVLQNIISQSYLMSTLDFFWISGWLSVAMLGLVWLTRAPRRTTVHVASE